MVAVASTNMEKYDIKSIILDLNAHLEEINLNMTETNLDMLNKIIFKLRNIDVIIENTDEDLLPQTIFSYYENIKEYCNDILKGNYNCLSNLNQKVDLLFSELIKYIDFNIILNNKSNIKNSIRNYKLEITKQRNSLESEIQDISNYIKEKKQNIENNNSDLNTKITNINSDINNLKSQYEQIKQNSNNIIDDCTKKINECIQNENDKLSKKYDEIKVDFEENYNKLSEDYKRKFDNLLNDIEQKDTKISQLIGIVGEKTRIGEYKKNADSSHKERIVWQFITVLLFLGAFIVMIYVTFISKNYDKFTIIKYIVSALLMGAATYTAKQASNSRKDEIYFRKQELELASIDVYLENMNDDSREEIKKTLATKMFGQAQNTYTNKYDEKKGFSADDIVKIIESIKNGN